MTADRDCELREKIDAGRLFCTPAGASRAIPARRSWSARAAARCRSPVSRLPRCKATARTKMIAVPAQAILRIRTATTCRELSPVMAQIAPAARQPTSVNRQRRRVAVGGDPGPVGAIANGQASSVPDAANWINVDGVARVRAVRHRHSA